MDEFPGLVHFIYVNRSTHQMMAPSVNVSQEIKDENMKLLIKIRNKVSWSYTLESFLVKNCLSETLFAFEMNFNTEKVLSKCHIRTSLRRNRCLK